MSKRSGTDGSLLTSLPWTIFALVFSVVPHLQFLPLWATVSFFTCSAWRWQVERRRWRLPPAWLRIVLSLMYFIGVLISYDSVSGVGPGSALLVVMAALKLMETKQRRDQFVLLFISIFLIMSSLLREQTIWSFPYLIAGVVLTMMAWLRMSNSPGVNPGQSFRTATRLLLYAAPLAIAMWIFFPRISTPFWAVPIDTGSATSGISNHMSPGDISSLSLSEAVSFRVRFDDDIPPPQQRYWRGLVLHTFDGRTWSGNEPSPGSRSQLAVEPLGAPVRYQITMEPTRQHWVLSLDIPIEWSLKQIFMAPQQQLARMRPIDQRISYEVVSSTDYRLNSNMSDLSKSLYTHLPENSNPRVAELARNMREAAGSEETYIEHVLQKFNTEEFFYTLEPPALGSNPVDRFMFDTRQGFCEHYASAFAVMMRAAGIPSRIVLGYQGGEFNPLGQYMIVRQADAHAWTEVWLPGRGWYRVDPTAAVAPERISAGRTGAMFDGVGASWGLTAPSELLYQMALTWDAMNAKWNEWILGYGPENQNRFLEWLGMDDPDWREMMLTLLAIVIVMIAIISVLLMIRYRPPRKDRAAVLYQNFTRNAGVALQRGETPLAYAHRLARQRMEIAQDAQQITLRYLDARYGPPDLSAIQELQAAITQFARRA